MHKLKKIKKWLYVITTLLNNFKGNNNEQNENEETKRIITVKLN